MEPARPDPAPSILSSSAEAIVLVAAWLATALAMLQSWKRDPFDPTLTGTDAYGHNPENALTQGLVLTSIELVAAVAALQPWTRRPRPAVTLGFLLLAAPWTLLSWCAVMHGGGILAFHAFWMVALDLLVLAAVVRRWASARRA